MSRYQHGYFWPSLTTLPYRSFLLAGLPSYIQYRHRAAVCMFELDIQLLLVPVKYRNTSPTSSSLLLQQCPACLVRLILIVFVTKTLWPIKAMLNLVLDVWILRINGHDRLVRSGNYCCSSIRVASVNGNKNSHQKITITHTQTTCVLIKDYYWIGSYSCMIGIIGTIKEINSFKNSYLKLYNC